MRLSLVALGILISASALAKPLPKGMKVSLKDMALYVEQDGLTVPLFDDDHRLADQVSNLTGAELSDDGRSIVVHADSCAMTEGIEAPLAEVEARLENVRGMQLHVKKKYADAIVHFTAAVKADPSTPVYVTNLLSAQSMAKLYDDADRTISSFAAAHLAWFAWRLAIDPELANVRGRAAARPFVAAKPTKLAFQALGDDIAVSPIGLVAVGEWNAFGGPGTDNNSELVLYDPRADVPPVRLAATAKHAVDPVLGKLGFEKRATTWVNMMGAAADLDHVTSPDKKVEVALGAADGKITITRGKQSATITAYGPILRIGFAGDIVVFQQRENGYLACDGDAQRSYSQIAVLR